MVKNVFYYIPTLNSEKTIKPCLESVLRLKPEKILIIDGGSTDNTLKIVKKYKIKIIKQKKKGLANARNLALDNCKSDFIASIDADCVLSKNWLKQVMKHLKDENVAGVCGKLIEKNQTSLADKWRTLHLKQQWSNQVIENPDFLFGSNSIFRTHILKQLGGYNEKYISNFEDVDISKRLKKRDYNIIYNPNAICHHLRIDNIWTLLKTARKWSFYSYPTPDSFFNLLIRLFIYNPHLCIKYLLEDIKRIKFELIPFTMLTLFYNDYYDMNYYVSKTKR